MADWYYAQGSVQRGPMAIELVIDSLRSGVLKSDDLVWREGLADWMPARQMPELAGAWRIASPPRMPPMQPMSPIPPMSPMSLQAIMPFSPPAPRVSPQPPLTPLAPLPPMSPPAHSPHSSLALASMVLGLVAFVLLPLGSMLGIPGLICGILALRGMRQTGMADNRGMAIAGVVLGIFWAIVGAMVVAAAALYFALQPAAMNLSVNPPPQNLQPPAFTANP